MSVQNKYNNCYFKIIKKKNKLISFRKLRENEYKRQRKCACAMYDQISQINNIKYNRRRKKSYNFN